MITVPIDFRHGLGDCVNFAHVAHLYRRHEIDVRVSGEANKQFIWDATGVALEPQKARGPQHPWQHRGAFWNLQDADCIGNKTAGNINVTPLPHIDRPQDSLWRELCGIELNILSSVRSDVLAEADRFLDGLQKPILALHAVGTNGQADKSIDAQTQLDLQRLLIRENCSVVVLDFDARAVQVGHERIRGIKPAWSHLSLEQLAALLSRCDLLVAVDSGPLHFARLTKVPVLGVFFNRGNLLPHRVAIPSPRLTSLVPDSLRSIWQDRLSLEIGWRFIDYTFSIPTAQEICASALSIIRGECTGLSPSTGAAQHVGMYLYKRIGYDERLMELRSDGTIGEGAGGNERRWFVRCVDNKPRLSIVGDSGQSICDLTLDSDGNFRGRWNRYERMEIALIRTHVTEVSPVVPAPIQPAISPSNNLVRHEPFWIRRDLKKEDLVIVEDVYENDSYRLSVLGDHIRTAKYVVDIGAHIGCFATLMHRMNPQARIVCVEACPENIDALLANVRAFADVVPAACTYETRPLVLMNTVTGNGGNTGSSYIATVDQIGLQDSRYNVDRRPLTRVTLEELLDRSGSETIDILKLDCEGSEFSILPNNNILNRVKLIVGEYHGYQRWEKLRESIFRDWDYRHLRVGEIGLFHLVNPAFAPLKSP